MAPSITSLANTRTGPCYVMGNAEHLNQLTLSNLVLSCNTIGVNRILRAVPVTWLLLADKPLLEAERERILISRPNLLLFAGQFSGEVASLRDAGLAAFLYDLHSTPYQRMGIPWPPEAPGFFRFSGNTGTYAIEAAALMGFTEIRLVGIDLRYDHEKSHFFGNGKAEGCELRELALPAYRQVYRSLSEKGIKIVNESPLDGPLDDFIPKEESPWLRK